MCDFKTLWGFITGIIVKYLISREKEDFYIGMVLYCKILTLEVKQQILFREW